jgi:hypothetical protein
MSGPSGVDDILKTFEEIRSAEASGGMSFQQPDMQSVASEELGSVGTERTSGGRRRRRTRRRSRKSMY